MPTFLERYLSGQRVEVWADLVALGDQVRQKPVLRDAQAVADETMRRARRNLEILIPRLAAAGYRFAAPAMERQLAKINKTLANPQLSSFVREQLERAVQKGTAPASVLDPAQNKLVQHNLAVKRKEKAALEAELQRMQTMPPLENLRIFYPPEDLTLSEEETADRYVEYIETFAKGPVPLSLQAWYQHVGYVSFMGSHEVLNPEGSAVADPLVMKSAYQMSLAVRTGPPQAPFVLPVSPDDLKKAGLPKSTPYYVSPVQYSIKVPNASADGQLENEWRNTTFVNYLRKAFEWAGLPGLERDPNPPREMISKLTEGLLPL